MFLFQKYWCYLKNNNTDGNQSAFQMKVFSLLIGGIKYFAADSNAVLKWCLHIADQGRNTKAMKEMAGIYSSSEK